VERGQGFATVETAGGKLRAWMPRELQVGEAARIALRPENMELGAPETAPNRFMATVKEQRYLGTQTSYDLAALGGMVEALEFGTAARYPVGTDVPVAIPPELCWAYPASET
jgi:iron(III) transport system ATP-binding protein